MKITFDIHHSILKLLEKECLQRGALNRSLWRRLCGRCRKTAPQRRPYPPLPTFEGGLPHVDVENRDLLEEFLNGRWVFQRSIDSILNPTQNEGVPKPSGS